MQTPSAIHQTQSQSAEPNHTPLFLLLLTALGLGVANHYQLAGFLGWPPLGVAALNVLAAGLLLEHSRRYSWLSILIALASAVLCAWGLPAQLDAQTFFAAAVNAVVVTLELTAVFFILRR